VATYLDRIVADHRAAAAMDVRPLDALVGAAERGDPCRGFRAALAGADRLAVISEIKRRSPSKGDLKPSLEPAELARAYVRGGASCLSVLTDATYFGGSVSDLQHARAAVALPVLRKDFTVSAHDVCDARVMGADCVLLIAAVLGTEEMAALHSLAVRLGLDVLVEVHDEHELQNALAVGATMIGVNQRDLVTFEVDHERAVRMAGVIPDGIVKVAESGVRGEADARSLADAGYDAVLVGESLVTATDPASALDALRVSRSPA